MGASSPLFQEPVQQEPPRTLILNPATVFTQPAPPRRPTKRENTHSPCSKIRGYRAEEFWITPWLLISMCTHGQTHNPTPCQIPDELNMHLKKSPQKKSCVQIKTQQINSKMHTPTLGSSSQPLCLSFLMDFPLRKLSFWALPALVVSSPGPARVPLSTGRETHCRGQTTTDKQHAGSPVLRLTELFSVASKEDTARSNLCIALVIPLCSVLGVEKKKLVKSQLQVKKL